MICIDCLYRSVSRTLCEELGKVAPLDVLQLSRPLVTSPTDRPAVSPARADFTPQSPPPPVCSDISPVDAYHLRPSIPVELHVDPVETKADPVACRFNVCLFQRPQCGDQSSPLGSA